MTHLTRPRHPPINAPQLSGTRRTDAWSTINHPSLYPSTSESQPYKMNPVKIPSAPPILPTPPITPPSGWLIAQRAPINSTHRYGKDVAISQYVRRRCEVTSYVLDALSLMLSSNTSSRLRPEFRRHPPALYSRTPHQRTRRVGNARQQIHSCLTTPGNCLSEPENFQDSEDRLEERRCVPTQFVGLCHPRYYHQRGI